MDKMFGISKKSRYSLRKRSKGLVPVLLGVATLALGVGVNSGSVSADEVSSDTTVTSVSTVQDGSGGEVTSKSDVVSVSEDATSQPEAVAVKEESNLTPVSEDTTSQPEEVAVKEESNLSSVSKDDISENAVEESVDKEVRAESTNNTRTEVDTSKQTPVSGQVEVPFNLGGDTQTSVAPRQIVMVLDASTSMTEGTSRGGSAQDFAYNTAKTIINSLGANDKATIVFAPVNNNINGIQTELTGDKETLLANLELYLQDPVSHRRGIPNVYGDQANIIGTKTPTEEVLASQPGFDKKNAYVLWLTDDWTSEDWDKVDTSFFNWVKENTSKQLAVVNTYSNEHGEHALSTESFRSIGGSVAINPSPEEVLAQFNKLTVTEIKDGATVSIKGDDSLRYSNIKVVNSSGQVVKTIADGSSISDNLGELPKGDYKLTFDYNGAFKEGHRDITATVHTKLANKDFNKVTPIDQANAVKTINTGRVLVSYKSGSKELAPSVSKFEGSDEGTAYDVSDLSKPTLTVEGKKYILTNSPATTGKIQKGTTEVTFEYRVGTAPFVVTFKNAQGVSLKADISKDLDIDSAYDISSEVPSKLTKDGKSYTLVNNGVKQSGTVSSNGTHLDFVYNEDLGKLTVVSKASDGTVLGSYEVHDTHIGTNFDETSKVKPNIDSADGKHYVLDNASLGNAKGQIDSLDKVVNIVYNESKGTVTVTYIDGTGKEFKPSEVLLGSSSYGVSYNAKDKYQDKIVLADGRTFTKADKGTSLVGKVDKETTVIPLSYTENKGNVTVTYLDENGKEFQPSEVLLDSTSYGVSYSAKDRYKDKIVLKDGRTFTRVDKGTSLVGKVDKDSTVIPLSYKENKGTVTVTYLDENGKEFKAKEVLLNGSSYGVSYDAKDKYLDKIVLPDGKTFTKSDKNVALSGKVDKDSIVIPLSYTENKGTVTVHYLDENGKEFKPTQILVSTSSYGVSYDANSKYLDKIVLDNGRVYKKVANTSNVLTGKIDKESTDINLNYKEVKTSLTLKFVANGKEIQQIVSLEDKSVGEDYDLTSQVPSRITVKGVGTFKLVSSDLALKGKLTEEPISLVAQYAPVMTKAKIMFVDETGKDIVPFIDVDNIQLDSSYDFSNYADKVITLADGRQFELTAIPENIKGIGLEDGVVIKLTYREIVKPVAKAESTTPVKESEPVQVATPVYQEAKVLPNTGDSKDNDAFVAMGLAMLTGGLGLVVTSQKRKTSNKG